MDPTDPRLLASLDAWVDERNRQRRLERGLVEQAREMGFPGKALGEAVEFLREKHKQPARAPRKRA